MEMPRSFASSSLFGEGEDMLISGGRKAMVHAGLEIVGEGKPPVVLREDSFTETRFTAVNVLTPSVVEDHGAENYWLAGEDGWFVLDLKGHAGPVDMLELVNTHNGQWQNWAAKEIRVHLSDSSDGPWELVVDETLEDSRLQTDPLPLQTFHFPERSAQFVRFKNVSGWGDGAGLSFFAVKHSGEPFQPVPNQLTLAY